MINWIQEYSKPQKYELLDGHQNNISIENKNSHISLGKEYEVVYF